MAGRTSGQVVRSGVTRPENFLLQRCRELVSHLPDHSMVLYLHHVAEDMLNFSNTEGRTCVGSKRRSPSLCGICYRFNTNPLSDIRIYDTELDGFSKTTTRRRYVACRCGVSRRQITVVRVQYKYTPQFTINVHRRRSRFTTTVSRSW